MYDELPDNIEDIRIVFKKRIGNVDVIVEFQHKKNVEKIIFSDHVKRELAKYRPSDIKKKRGLAVFSLSFSLLAIVAFVALPEPLNWVMALGCIIPFVGPLIRYGMKKRNGYSSRHTKR